MDLSWLHAQSSDWASHVWTPAEIAYVAELHLRAKRLSNNLLLRTDGYKPSHWKMYPPGLQYLQSYFESRVGAKYEFTAFFGLQYFAKKYLTGVQVTTEKINEAEKFFSGYFGTDTIFNRKGWEYIRDKCGGKLPISIRAVEEGTKVPTGNALMVLENTDPNCAWLVNYLETLLVEIW